MIQKCWGYITEKIQKSLNKEEIVNLTAVILIDNKNPELDVINETVIIEHGEKQLINTYFFDSIIRRAYFITSKK